MTDKEKIEQIMKLRGLNNTEFANLIGISPGALSHIISERTKPTLQILRSVKHVCPDINPGWLFYDEEPMMLADKVDVSGVDVSSDSDEDPVETMFGSGSPDLFSGLAQQYPSSASAVAGGNQAQATGKRNAVNGSRSAAGSSVGEHGYPNVNNVLRGDGASFSSASMVSIPEIVGETVKQMNKPQRKIVEVRIFFDDGTFEVFS